MNIKSLYFYFYCFIYTHLLLFCSTNTAHSLKNKKINTLFLSISKPQFSSHDTTVIMSSEKITSIIRPILRKHLANTNYDRMFPVLQFLDYYDHCLKVYANLCPLECYKSFTYIPITLEERGGSCVGLTLSLYNILPEVFKAYIVASKLASKHQQIGFPEYAHTAILIK